MLFHILLFKMVTQLEVLCPSVSASQALSLWLQMSAAVLAAGRLLGTPQYREQSRGVGVPLTAFLCLLAFPAWPGVCRMLFGWRHDTEFLPVHLLLGLGPLNPEGHCCSP